MNNLGADDFLQWALPTPVKRAQTDTTHDVPATLMPPLPPVNDLSIFDHAHPSNQSSTLEIKSENENGRESAVDSNTASHPDDVLQGEFLRTEEELSNHNRADSFYLVYNERSKLVKVGLTLYTYEECFSKYKKLYGHLDAYHFLKIENDMTRERLEKAFYQFFCETRLFAGKEFFRPEDSRGRPMVPIYLALLAQLASSDTRSIRRFYMMHGTTALAARQWIEEQHQSLGGPGAVAEVSQEEASALSTVRIISSENAAVLSQLDQEAPQNAEEGNSSSSSSSDDSGDNSSESENGDNKQRKHRRTDAERALAPAHTAVSLYLVHSARSDLVKVGLSTGTYEQCQRKHAAVYGHLDAFHFVAIENELLCWKKTRLERLFYRLFQETRITPGREFFKPCDAQGRDMLPLYVSVLRLLASADARSILRFYAQHRYPAAMHAWKEQQHQQLQETVASPPSTRPSDPPAVAVPLPPSPEGSDSGAAQVMPASPVPPPPAAAAPSERHSGAMEPTELEVINLP